MAKLNFVSDETIRIDLEEGTWVEVKKEIPFEQFRGIFMTAEVMAYSQRIQGGGNGPKDQSVMAGVNVIMPILKIGIVAWSDKETPCTPKNIEKLSPAAILFLSQKIMPLYSPQKKSSQSSQPISNEDTSEIQN